MPPARPERRSDCPVSPESDGPAEWIIDPDVDLGDPAQVTEASPREWDLLLAIGAGGVLGADARYGLARAWPHGAAGFPWSTVLINTSGCLAIGIVMAVLLSRPVPPRLARPFLGVGILGGYTTYSTFATDAVGLVVRHQSGLALAYLAATVAACGAAVWFATSLTSSAIRRLGRSTAIDADGPA